MQVRQTITGRKSGRGVITAATLALGVLLLIASCSNTAEPKADVDAVLRNPTGEQLLLPLDEYLFKPTESAAYERALSVAIAGCMTEQGFDYPVLPRPADDATQNAARYGIVDLDEVAVFGYHLPPRSAEVDALLAANSEARSVEWGEAFDGGEGSSEGPGGCLGRAYEALGGAQALFDDTEYVEGLAADSYNRSADHSEVEEVIGSWADCLAEAGYQDAESPNMFSSSVLRAEAADDNDLDDPVVKPGQKISDAEIAAATADARCQREVNLTGVWFAVESAIQRQFIDDHAEALSQIRERKEERLRLAAQIATP